MIKIHKKNKVNGHVVHRLPKCPGLYYTVEPEHSCIAVYRLKYDELNDGLCYAEFEDIAIHTSQLGRPGYLQEQIGWISKKHFKEEKKMNTTNIRHFVLVAKIKSDNDRVMHDCEYIQVVQQGDKFMLLFDAADITQTEAADLTKYLSGVLAIKDVSLSVNPEFINYAISFSGIFDFDDDSIHNLCSILADGAKHKHTYPLRARYKAVSSVSSISFFIQENADTPIYKKEWPSLLNGTLHFWPYVIQRSESRPYIHNLVDRDPSQNLSVIDGRVRGLPFHKYPLIYGDIFHKEYSDKDELISDFRGLIDDRKIFANASKVYIEFQPDREKI